MGDRYSSDVEGQNAKSAEVPAPRGAEWVVAAMKYTQFSAWGRRRSIFLWMALLFFLASHATVIGLTIYILLFIQGAKLFAYVAAIALPVSLLSGFLVQMSLVNKPKFLDGVSRCFALYDEIMGSADTIPIKNAYFSSFWRVSFMQVVMCGTPAVLFYIFMDTGVKYNPVITALYFLSTFFVILYWAVGSPIFMVWDAMCLKMIKKFKTSLREHRFSSVDECCAQFLMVVDLSSSLQTSGRWVVAVMVALCLFGTVCGLVTFIFDVINNPYFIVVSLLEVFWCFGLVASLVPYNEQMDEIIKTASQMRLRDARGRLRSAWLPTMDKVNLSLLSSSVNELVMRQPHPVKVGVEEERKELFSTEFSNLEIESMINFFKLNRLMLSWLGVKVSWGMLARVLALVATLMLSLLRLQ